MTIKPQILRLIMERYLLSLTSMKILANFLEDLTVLSTRPSNFLFFPANIHVGGPSLEIRGVSLPWFKLEIFFSWQIQIYSRIFRAKGPMFGNDFVYLRFCEELVK